MKKGNSTAMSDFKIRPYKKKDFESVYEVCLKTGDAGRDATHLYKDPKALGHLYVGPYVTLEPSLAFVLEDALGVCGYVLGAFDTKTFYMRFIKEWLPPLQKLYPEPQSDPKTWTCDERIYHEIHHPDIKNYLVLEPYPSHLHIDLLTRAQGQGNGRRMMNTLLEALKARGSRAVFLAMHPENKRAFVFYQKMGFHVIEEAELPRDTLYLGLVFV
jgi:ribosomal protein S18 acetylase RimI-like enzyme